MSGTQQLLEDRGADYGDCVENHENIAGHMSLILGIPVSARQAALCMVGVKLARESYQHKDDNCDDGEAYFHIAKVCAHAEGKHRRKS
jgi:hypothetical protein